MKLVPFGLPGLNLHNAQFLEMINGVRVNHKERLKILKINKKRNIN